VQERSQSQILAAADSNLKLKHGNIDSSTAAALAKSSARAPSGRPITPNSSSWRAFSACIASNRPLVIVGRRRWPRNRKCDAPSGARRFFFSGRFAEVARML
jgi:hypothetical protein